MHEGTTQLIDELERQARARSSSLEATLKLPQVFTERHYPLTPRQRLDLQRLKVAWRLARDLDALRDLLAGVPIDPARVHKDELAAALTASMVQLVRPIDILHRRVAA